MKIIGVMLQRNEVDVVLFNALHHLRSVKLDQLIIGDNGSFDRSKQALRRLEKLDPRLMILDMPGDFEQAVRVNKLYQIAIDNGADWVIPLDADEFIPISRRSLEHLLSQTNDIAVRMDIRNFVQRRNAVNRKTHNITSMFYQVSPIGTGAEAMDLVNSGQIGFVESVYPPKYIWKANKSLTIWKGNHGANIDTSNVSNSIPLNHVPLRSKLAIIDRIQSIERLEKGPAGESWHIKRLVNVDVEAEWKLNSYEKGMLNVNGERRQLKFNAFFIKVFLKYALTVKRLVGNLH